MSDAIEWIDRLLTELDRQIFATGMVAVDDILHGSGRDPAHQHERNLRRLRKMIPADLVRAVEHHRTLEKVAKLRAEADALETARHE